MSYIIPALLLLLFLYGLIKKAPLYDYFIDGAKGAIPLCVTLFPYLVVIFILVELLQKSNAITLLTQVLSPVLSFLGIPEGIFELVLFRPFSGSGSIVIIEKIFANFGVDSYEARVACVISGSSETVFYMCAIYFSKNGIKKFNKALAISLLSTFLGIILSCLICKVI